MSLRVQHSTLIAFLIFSSIAMAQASRQAKQSGRTGGGSNQVGATLLGTAKEFAVLAGTTVTNANASVISGSVGVSPGSAITGFPPGIVISGTFHAADAVALQAQTDLTTAYNTLALLPATQDLTGMDLGGLTLLPGVYSFSSTAQLTGTLTLNTLGNPDALFVFQIGSMLTTASNSSVVTINGPDNCNVYWQIGSSATLGTGTHFQGNIVALTSITLTSNVTINQGRALARNGQVSLDGNIISAGCTCLVGPGVPDCNSNNVDDDCDIDDGTSTDCNSNGTPDDCDIADGTPDCNGNGIPDSCDIDDGTSVDCNSNGIPDDCDIANGTPDCNANGIPDTCDIASGTPDCNANGIPDSCDIANGTPDCNGNGVPDLCDIAGGAPDCNGNDVPDVCDFPGRAPDCNDNGIPDICDIANGTPDCNANGIPDTCDIAGGTPDCNGNGVPDSCDMAGGAADCNGNGIPDTCDMAGGAPDCNRNGIPDTCDIAKGAPDCNRNGIPDTCDIAGGAPDCNANGVPDTCDIGKGGPDCNGNGIPDACDIAGGAPDCNSNGVPDTCDIGKGAPDCNGNGIPDVCDIAGGTPDCNSNGVPDVCDFPGGAPDCNANGIPDICDIAGGAPDCNSNGIPDTCDIAGGAADCDSNGIPDTCDTANGAHDCDLNHVPDVCDITGGAADCDSDGILDVCNDECLANCTEFDRTENLSPNDTLTLITRFHNPQSDQGYVYSFAVNAANAPIRFDWLIGQSLVLDGREAFAYSINALDYRGAVPAGTLTDIDGDGIRDLNGLEYERTPGELLVPRFIGQRNDPAASQLILINLSGGLLFDTTVDFLIYNDNEQELSASHTFRCWEKIDLLQISGAFLSDFLLNSTSNNPAEFLGSSEYGWFRMSGGTASSTALSIQDPAIYGVYIERIGTHLAADLPFETCTQSGHLLPKSPFGDNEEQATGGSSDRDCSSSIARRRPGSLLLYPEYDNRSAMVSVLTVTNTNETLPTRVHMVYVGR